MLIKNIEKLLCLVFFLLRFHVDLCPFINWCTDVFVLIFRLAVCAFWSGRVQVNQLCKHVRAELPERSSSRRNSSAAEQLPLLNLLIIPVADSFSTRSEVPPSLTFAMTSGQDGLKSCVKIYLSSNPEGEWRGKGGWGGLVMRGSRGGREDLKAAVCVQTAWWSAGLSGSRSSQRSGSTAAARWLWTSGWVSASPARTADKMWRWMLQVLLLC